MSIRNPAVLAPAAVASPRPDAPEAGPAKHAINARSLVLVFFTALAVVALVDWFATPTERLYLDEDSTPAQQQGTVWQHFAVRGHDVVPEIISQDEARFTFPISLRSRTQLEFTAHPEGTAEYEIFLRTDAGEQKIASEKIDQPRRAAVSLASVQGELRFVVHGRIAWFDLRLTGQFQWPLYVVLAAVALVAFSRISHPASRIPHRASRIAHPAVAFAASTFLCLVLVELFLRAFLLKLPPAVLTARHDLGLSALDARWIDSPRYRQRFRPNLKTYCEWWHGDIVRMGFLPADLFPAEHHRYPFETDAEGFRNPAVPAKIDVAALGDSFVDAMTSPREDSWPSQLERITGQAVQNYGTSSYGPLQELYVLEDFAIRHQPREVVLGYFAGNDLFDAERFDRWEHGGDKPGEEATGWRLQKKFRRYEMLFLTTIVHTMLRTDVPKETPARADAGKKFDRGLFEIPTENGAVLRFAFMPPYLQQLASSRPETERSRGWQLTRTAIRKMRASCAQQGTRFTVLFIPSKEAVYWPLVDHSLGPEDLQHSLQLVSSYNHMGLRAGDIRANRLVQNELMREFCAAENIPFLDLTPALEQAAASGHAVYFADDAHWNAAGHELAARELARFLAAPR